MPVYLNDNVLGGGQFPREELLMWIDTGIYESFPGTGTAWGDLSGLNNDVLLVNANTENIHQSIDFDGSSDYARVSNLNYGSSNTIEYCSVMCWMKTAATGVNYYDNWALLDFDKSENFTLYIREDDGKIGLSFDDGGGTHDLSSSTACNDGEWHHVGFTFTYASSPEVTFYLDGAADGTSTTPTAAFGTGQSTRYAIIGDGSETSSYASPSTNGYYFNGEIALMMFWEGASTAVLSAQEVLTLYNKDRARFGL
jgi:hypothetical protein